MPLVRIDLPATTSHTEAAAVSRVVHQSMVEVFNVPQDDMFQVVARRPAGEIVCTPQFLGIEHSDQVVFVQIACSPGRTTRSGRSRQRSAAGGSRSPISHRSIRAGTSSR